MSIRMEQAIFVDIIRMCAEFNAIDEFHRIIDNKIKEVKKYSLIYYNTQGFHYFKVMTLHNYKLKISLDIEFNIDKEINTKNSHVYLNIYNQYDNIIWLFMVLNSIHKLNHTVSTHDTLLDTYEFSYRSSNIRKNMIDQLNRFRNYILEIMN